MHRYHLQLYAAITCALFVAGCDRPEVRESRLRLDPATAAHVTWRTPLATQLIVLFGGADTENTRRVAATLSYPDRAVLTLRPADLMLAPGQCAALVNTAVNKFTEARRKSRRPAPTPLVLVGMNAQGAAALAVAAAPQATDVRAAVPYEYCPGNEPSGELICAAGAATQGNVSDVPIVAITDKSKCGESAFVTAFTKFQDARVIAADGGNRIDLLSTTVDQVLGRVGGPAQASSDDLPVTPLPAQGAGKTLAIFLSGDGGWADIDKQVGEELAARGIAVVGFDSLKYFWQRKDPTVAAAALARVIAQYSAAWKRDDIVLIGYSFGADVLPLLWQHLDVDTRARVSNIVLLGLSANGAFEVTVGGWVGVAPAHSLPTVPAIRSISGARVLCIHGNDEDGKACPALVPYGAEAVGLDGGHHFGGDYKKVAQIILKHISPDGTATTRP